MKHYGAISGRMDWDWMDLWVGRGIERLMVLEIYIDN